MPNDKDHMDFVRLLDMQEVRQMDQVQSGVQDAAKLLRLHYEELVKAGFKKSQAYDMTFQFHAAWVESIFDRIGD